MAHPKRRLIRSTQMILPTIRRDLRAKHVSCMEGLDSCINIVKVSSIGISLPSFLNYFLL